MIVPEFWHDIKSIPFKCDATGKTTNQVWTDHSRPGCHNSCEHCNPKRFNLAENLHELNERRGKRNASP